MMKSFWFFIGFFFMSELCGQSVPGFTINPNPAQQKTQIELKNIDIQNVKLEVYNLFGMRVNEVYIQTLKFEHKFILHFPDLNEGIYLIRIAGDGFEMTQKLKVQH